MSEKRKFIASSELFSDFTVDISLYNVETIDDIIKIFVRELKECLIKNNFTNLVEIVNKKNFFICDHE